MAIAGKLLNEQLNLDRRVGLHRHFEFRSNLRCDVVHDGVFQLGYGDWLVRPLRIGKRWIFLSLNALLTR